MCLKANIQSFSFGAGNTEQSHQRSPGEFSLDRLKYDYNICYFSRPKYWISGYLSSDPNEQGNKLLGAVVNYTGSAGYANSNSSLWNIYTELIDNDSERLVYRRLGLFGPDQSLDFKCKYPDDGSIPQYTDVFKSYTYDSEANYPEGEKNYIRGIKNYIRINTSDDDTPNSGGFTLTAFYLSGLNINNSSVTATIKS